MAAAEVGVGSVLFAALSVGVAVVVAVVAAVGVVGGVEVIVDSAAAVLMIQPSVLRQVQ